MKKHVVKKTLKNNLYIIGLIREASPGFILLTVVITLTALVDTFSNTWLSKVVFDGMAFHTPYIDIVKVVLILLGLMLISSYVRSYYNQKKSLIEKEKIRTFIRTKLLKQTRKLDFSCFENPEFYTKYTRAMAEADERASAILDSISSVSYSLFTILTLFAIIITLDPILIIFVICGVVLSFIINTYLGKLRYQYKNERTNDERGQNYIHRIFYEPQYSQNIKMDTMTDYFINKYKNISKHLILIIKKRATKIEILDFLSQIQNTVLQIVMILILTYRVYSGLLTIGDYAALLNSTFSLIFQLNILFALIPQFYEHALFIENLKVVMDYKPKIEKDGGIELKEADVYSIEFKNVSFKYPGQDKNVINNISFLLHTNESLALVGHNGAGKSTIVKLMVRLYDVNEGSILVNGRNIKEYNVFSLRRSFSTVFQDYQFYAASVAENILGLEYTTELQNIVDYSLKQSGLYEKIYSLPNNIDTQISKEFDEHGILLSGGETQKLALAKVYAKKSPFVILDEPSSALDPISEHELNENMINACKDRAMLLISHRLSTTKSVDRILLLDHGSILEEGNHEELMKRNGLYKKMFVTQAMNYQLDQNV